MTAGTSPVFHNVSVSDYKNPKIKHEDNNVKGKEDEKYNTYLKRSHSHTVEEERKQVRKSGKHQSSACCSCQKKRKKCDGSYPKCSGCIKQGVECTIIYPPTGQEIKRNHLEFLEKTITQLQDQLQAYKNEKDDLLDLSGPAPARSAEQPISCNPGLPQEVELITLGAAGESRYIGESSAYSIAKVINSTLNSYPTRHKDSRYNGSTFSSPASSTTTSYNNCDPPFKFPDTSTASALLATYKDTVQFQYPFLEWKYIESCYLTVIVNRSKDAVPNFFIFMILAIGSQLTYAQQRKSQSNFARAYYQRAFDFIAPVIENVDLRTVQAYLLLAIFSQKVSDGNSVWQSTGLAIRTSVALGLHRRSYRRNKYKEVNEIDDLKARVFWSAYGIERINGLLLGRPFSISDIDIDVPFPLETEETKVACHVFKLRSIQSNICTFIYNPLKKFSNPEENDATKVQILIELNDWTATFPFKENASSTFETNNWCLISYHNSILLLLRPTVLHVAQTKEKSTKRDLEWFKVFTESASAVCINYKSMHLRGKLDYTWLAMHCCFVSGISFLYCIWLDKSLNVLEWKRKSIIYETINACSSIMYVLAERWESASIFRDTFERFSMIVKSFLDEKDISKTEEEITDVCKTGVFVEGSIEIDSYLRGLTNKNRFQGEYKTPITPLIDPIKETDTFGNDEALWEFLESTGDVYLRNLFNEMEDSINL